MSNSCTCRLLHKFNEQYVFLTQRVIKRTRKLNYTVVYSTGKKKRELGRKELTTFLFSRPANQKKGKNYTSKPKEERK